MKLCKKTFDLILKTEPLVTLPRKLYYTINDSRITLSQERLTLLWQQHHPAPDAQTMWPRMLLVARLYLSSASGFRIK